MAGIDEKMSALAFTLTSSEPANRIAQLIRDAADMASTHGGKVTVSQTNPETFAGVVKNFVRIQHGAFITTVRSTDGEASIVSFGVGDYMRVRDTIFGFVPVSPWSAPAYTPLRTYSDYLRSRL